MEVRGADVHLLPSVAQPEFGPILHGAVAALLLALMEERQQLVELRGKFGRSGLGHRKEASGGDAKGAAEEPGGGGEARHRKAMD